MESSTFLHSIVVKDTSPSKTMECNDSVYSGVVKDTTLSTTMEYVDSVNNGIVKVVSDKVKNVVHFFSQNVKTDNFLQSKNVDTLKVVTNDSDTIGKLDSVKTTISGWIKKNIVNYIHVAIHVLYFFEGIRKRIE